MQQVYKATIGYTVQEYIMYVVHDVQKWHADKVCNVYQTILEHQQMQLYKLCECKK